VRVISTPFDSPDSNIAASQTSTGRTDPPLPGRLASFGILAVAIALLMMIFEIVKQWIHPDISAWESHVLTVIFSSVIGGATGVLLLRKQDALYRAVLDEGRERERAAAEAQDALARLHASIDANRDAQQQIQMLAQTVRSISECISITDMDDRVLFVNKAFLDTYGFEEADLMGQSIALVRSSRTPDEIARAVLTSTLSGGWRGEVWNRRKDGTDFQVFLSTAIVRDDLGVPAALVGVARDITEDKRTEEALKRGRESESIVSLARGIAHEFNNVIQAIMANTALAMEDVPSHGPVRESLQGVMSASERAANLTSQLLAYAGRGAFVVPVDLDVNDVIRLLVPAFRPILPAGSTLALDLASDLPGLRADHRQLEQVLRSLVTNAAEAMAGRSGTITIRTRAAVLPSLERHGWMTADVPPAGRHILLTVEDQGSGIDARMLARIFDPFFSTKFLGRGMGLPAVMGIARSMGGSVAVDSEVGVGTRVIVACPLELTPATR